MLNTRAKVTESHEAHGSLAEKLDSVINRAGRGQSKWWTDAVQKIRERYGGS